MFVALALDVVAMAVGPALPAVVWRKFDGQLEHLLVLVEAKHGPFL